MQLFLNEQEKQQLAELQNEVASATHRINIANSNASDAKIQLKASQRQIDYIENNESDISAYWGGVGRLFVALEKDEVILTAQEKIEESTAKIGETEAFLERLHREKATLQKQFEQFVKEHTYVPGATDDQ